MDRVFKTRDDFCIPRRNQAVINPSNINIRMFLMSLSSPKEIIKRKRLDTSLFFNAVKDAVAVVLEMINLCDIDFEPVQPGFAVKQHPY